MLSCCGFNPPVLFHPVVSFMFSLFLVISINHNIAVSSCVLYNTPCSEKNYLVLSSTEQIRLDLPFLNYSKFVLSSICLNDQVPRIFTWTNFEPFICRLFACITLCGCQMAWIAFMDSPLTLGRPGGWIPPPWRFSPVTFLMIPTAKIASLYLILGMGDTFWHMWHHLDAVTWHMSWRHMYMTVVKIHCFYHCLLIEITFDVDVIK